jgi:hypothetical protein
MTYKVEFQHAAFEQLAIGLYGAETLPYAYALAVKNQDKNFFLDRVVGASSGRRKDGAFKTKKAAQAALDNLKGADLIGRGWKMAKGQPAYGLIARIVKVS